MSIAKRKLLDYIEIYVYTEMWNVKTLFFVPNAQIRYQNIVKCQDLASWWWC